jgi:hypothetical protein
VLAGFGSVLCSGIVSCNTYEVGSFDDVDQNLDSGYRPLERLKKP